jgi:hypothetical protein
MFCISFFRDSLPFNTSSANLKENVLYRIPSLLCDYVNYTPKIRFEGML